VEGGPEAGAQREGGVVGNGGRRAELVHEAGDA
jgi:hypothetical protein